MRILVVGAGAVGGYFGARLAQAGRDVTFLVRASRAQQLRRDGLRIVSPHGDATISPQLVAADEIAAPYDIVLLGVKGYSLDAAMDDFAPAVGPKTMILPVQNGMRHIEVLEKRFGAEPVIGGICLVVTELDDAGTIVQMNDMQHLEYGERNGSVTQRIRDLDATLQGAGFEAQLSADITQAMWEKWVTLASLGGVTCLMRGSIGEVVAAPGGAKFSLGMLAECAAIAAACGHQPSDALLTRVSEIMSTPGSPLTASMYRDLRKGAPVEADTIVGDLLEHGRARGVQTPLLEAAYLNLCVYESARRARAAQPAVV
jgi:2-dehydropantoate 2-reductase